LVGKPVEKRPLGRERRRKNDITVMRILGKSVVRITGGKKWFRIMSTGGH
jgi:hypothetical protein